MVLSLKKEWSPEKSGDHSFLLFSYANPVKDIHLVAMSNRFKMNRLPEIYLTDVFWLKEQYRPEKLPGFGN
jgi:hypothetical protein